MPRRLALIAAVGFAVLTLLSPAALAGGGPAETVVLVNAASDDSRRVAAHYVKARQIPSSQVLELRCTSSLDVPMADFVRDVVDPVRTLLAERGLEDRVRFVVLTQGMPIRARTASGGDVSTTAALALMHSSLCGMPQVGIQFRPPPYAGTMSQMAAAPCADTARYLHVTALLSTTADEAIALVDRSVASDGTAPKGALFLFQDANGNASMRNDAYEEARQQLEALGAKSEHVPAGADRATGRKRVMGYVAGGSYSGVTPDGVKSNEYLPGALCDHLQSFGAVPQNFDPDTKRHTQFPITHMVRAGITGVHGAVQEPYSIAFPDADLFTSYLQGATLAETFDARIPTAYWMNLVLGDPLCAPYADRPKVTLAGAPSGTWSGTVKLSAAAPGAKRVAAYVDGVEVASSDGDRLDASIETLPFADGAHQVLVEATGADAWEARGWAVVGATFVNPSLRVLVRPARFKGALRVPLSRAPAANERPPTLSLLAGGRPLPGTSRVDGAALVFELERPAETLPVEVVVDGMTDPVPVRWDVLPSASAVSVEAPAGAAAGDNIKVRVTVLDARAAPIKGWRGRVELRLEDLPVRIAAVDAHASDEGVVEIPARFTRSGTVALRVSLPQDGVGAAAKLTIASGPPAVATSPQSSVPLGQATDVDVVVNDAFGNRCDAFEGEISIAFPDDAAAIVPAPVRLTKADRGHAVFRDVIVARAGPLRLVITDGAGKVWSQANEGVTAAHAPIHGWLVAQGAGAKDAGLLAAENPAKDADRDGCVAGGRLWRRFRAHGDDGMLPAGATKDGEAVAAVTFVRALAATKVRVLGAGAARIVLLVDGKEVFDGTPKSADPRAKREPLADVALSEGVHRLTVVATRKDRAVSFWLEIDDGAGKHPDQVVVLGAAEDAAPATFVASGRVRRGGAGTKVIVKTSDGTERSASPDAAGVWFVEGLAPGDVEVRAEGARPFQPSSRKATLAGRHAVDLDFVGDDKEAPTVKLDGAATRFAKSLLVEPAVEDDDGVREVRLLLDGAEVAKLTAAPWRLAADVNGRARGKHEVVVVAVDPSGNEGRSAPLAVTLIDDAKGPVVKVAGLNAGQMLKKKAAVAATVTDELPVASVRFRLDGKDLGDARTAAPFEVDLDPAGLSDGAHTLEVVARDLDGNETVAAVKFRTK